MFTKVQERVVIGCNRLSNLVCLKSAKDNAACACSKCVVLGGILRIFMSQSFNLIFGSVLSIIGKFGSDIHFGKLIQN